MENIHLIIVNVLIKYNTVIHLLEKVKVNLKSFCNHDLTVQLDLTKSNSREAKKIDFLIWNFGKIVKLARDNQRTYTYALVKALLGKRLTKMKGKWVYLEILNAKRLM